jgi:hypothetical protein
MIFWWTTGPVEPSPLWVWQATLAIGIVIAILSVIAMSRKNSGQASANSCGCALILIGAAIWGLLSGNWH